jgi:hypothetical protein
VINRDLLRLRVSAHGRVQLGDLELATTSARRIRWDIYIARPINAPGHDPGGAGTVTPHSRTR